MITRRGLILGTLAAPVIVKYGVLMPVKRVILPEEHLFDIRAVVQEVSRHMRVPGREASPGVYEVNLPAELLQPGLKNLRVERVGSRERDIILFPTTVKVTR